MKEKFTLSTLQSEGEIFTTKSIATFDEKKAIHNAILHPTRKISEYINQTFVIDDVFIQKVKYNTDDGVIDGYRIIIFTDNGETISTSSMGVLKSLISIFKFFGMPEDWKSSGEVMTVKLVQLETKSGRYFNLETV